MYNRFRSMFRYSTTNKRSSHKGMALLTVLLVTLFAVLIITPILAFTYTGIATSQKVYEPRSQGLYAADAGIEDAYWQIKYDNIKNLRSIESNSLYSEYDYASHYNDDMSSRPVTEGGNSIVPEVTIQNVWIPGECDKEENVPKNPAPSYLESVINYDPAQNNLIVTGNTIEATAGTIPGMDRYGNTFHFNVSQYRIRITYNYKTYSSLKLKTIGIWFPHGANYGVDYDIITSHSELGHWIDSNGIQQDPLSSPEAKWGIKPDVIARGGNMAAIWDFSELTNPEFSALAESSSPHDLYITCYFAPIQKYQNAEIADQIKPQAVSWVTTKSSTLPFSWNSDIKVFNIQSTSGDTSVNTYVAKTQERMLEGSIAGDYYATGNTILAPGSDIRYKNVVVNPSSASITADNSTIPTDAEVSKATLYWSAWKKSGSTSNTIQTVPNGNGDISGSWTSTPATTPLWDCVNETIYNDADYITGSGSSTTNYCLFSFNPFSIPSNATITNLKVYARAWKTSSNSDNIRLSIRINGNNYNGSSNSPTTTRTLYSYTWNNNPNTNAAWTVADLTGTGSHFLQQIGVYSTDLNPSVYVSMVYAEVTYTSASTLNDSCTFSIDDGSGPRVVSFDAGGHPQLGGQIISTTTQQEDDMQGYSYSCKTDVTALIRAYSKQPVGSATNVPGYATYTVRDVDYDMGNTNIEREIAYAGWSLVIIYTSPTTLGHFLYIYDTFANSHGPNPPDFITNPDGGTISGFIVPTKVDGEVNAARLTCFVGEGDDQYDGDYIMMNGTKLWDGTATGDNVYNGKFVRLTSTSSEIISGIDIDTLGVNPAQRRYITWDSGILHEGDSTAKIKMVSPDDQWNLIYMILSFRSTIATGGQQSFIINEPEEPN